MKLNSGPKFSITMIIDLEVEYSFAISSHECIMGWNVLNVDLTVNFRPLLSLSRSEFLPLHRVWVGLF